MINSIHSKLKRILYLDKPFIPTYSHEYVTVFSHPRSGTHFLEAFLAENFYKEENLAIDRIVWGHWANRSVNTAGNEYGKLFGSHIYPNFTCRHINYPVLYIYRDGRAVAYSIWRTENFMHPKYKGISFSDFLKLKLDWIGSPAFKCKEKMNIAQHWNNHVNKWLAVAKKNANILPVRYENLVNEPYSVYQQVHKNFFSGKQLLNEYEINTIPNAVGLAPNSAKPDAWRDKFSHEDIDFFNSFVDSRLLYN